MTVTDGNLMNQRAAMPRTARRQGTILTGLLLLLVSPALSACTAASQETAQEPPGASAPAVGGPPAVAPSTGATSTGATSTDGAVAKGGYTSVSLPSAHVHGVARNPGDDRVYLASHDGLFRYDPTGPVLVSPVIDLMGFTVAGPDRFYASGHPGPGVDLPQPVGLIESVDAGATWAVRSRGGESDFHTMTAAGDGVLGFDGVLRLSPDAEDWSVLEPPVAPYAIAASADGSDIVMTSQSGPVRSSDGGTTWDAINDAPLLQVVDWADEDTVVGVTPAGEVAVSDDAGVSWATRGDTADAPQAVGAHTRQDGSLSVLVVTGSAVLESTDGAGTFAPLVVR